MYLLLTLDTDTHPSSQELEVIEQQVQHELADTQTNVIHPRAMEILPLSTHMPQPLLLADVARLEQLVQDGETIETYAPHILSPAIEMERYVEFGDGENRDYDRMYTALSYGILRDRNSRLMEQTSELSLEAHNAIKAHLHELATSYSSGIDRKRHRIDEVNAERERKLVQLHPVTGYLEMRWQSGLQSLVDQGISRINEAAAEL